MTATKPTSTKHTCKPANAKPNKPIWLSPSSINAYLRCPRSFYLSKIQKAEQQPSIHLIRGIAVHNAVGQFYRHRLNNCANIDLTDLKRATTALFTDEWNRQKKSLDQLDLTDDELTFYLHDSQKMMLNFLHDFIKDRGFERPAPIIEMTLFDNKIRLLGRIDAIHRERSPPLIIDFKTCKSKELTEDYKRQLALYSILYENHFREKPCTAIHYLKFPDGLQTYQISDSYIQETLRLIDEIHSKIQSRDINDYPCTCGWCHRNFILNQTKKDEPDRPDR